MDKNLEYMKCMKKHLLLVTSGFPFGESERSFLEIEFNQLIRHFQVIVLATTNETDAIIYPLNEEIKVYHFRVDENKNKEYIPALKRKEVREELKESQREGNRKNRIIRIRSVLGYAARAEACRKFMENIVRQYDIDMIYTYWCTPATLAAIQIKRNEPELKVITRMHGYDLYVERTGKAMWQPFRRYITANIDKIVFACKYAKKYYIEHWAKACADKCMVSYIGAKAYKRVVWDESEVLSLISCSNVIELKRVHLIVDALALVPEKYLIKWIHIGGGELLDDIKMHAKEKLGNKSNISYEFTGAIPNGRIKEIYCQINPKLFISTSATEGGAPISIVEAFSMGIPAMGTEVGGIKDLINEEQTRQTGYLFSVEAMPENICDLICKYMDLPVDVQKRLGENAYNIWKENFNAEKNAKKLMIELEKEGSYSNYG